MATMSDEEEDDFCFGQREPPLVDYVKQILRNYTEGQLLKELTQNADDARATTVKFLYDSRQHSTNRLYCGEGIGDLSPYQGPALCAFNDATFKENDWTSIQNLSRSEKKDDPTKVGRFGMGFVSVYHVTDMPSILSGNYLAFMDPSETLFEYKGKQRGRKIHKKRSDIFKEPKFADQFSPYKNLFEGHPGLIEGQSFDGAMFRFPLRSRSSVISENVIDGEDARNLLDLFVDDAKILLLFLKKVGSITVGERLAERERSLFSATISSQTKVIVQTSRDNIIKRLTNNERQTFSTIFPMHIKIKECTIPTKYKWLLSIYLGGSDILSEISTLATEYDRFPLVGVAMQVFSRYVPTLEGRTFCFLPLPPSENNSGLPVHVNADFCVSDDRRSIKWPVVDRSDKMSTWNQLLLQHLFPKAYVKLILRAIELYGTGEDDVSVECIYQTWPDMEYVRFPWKDLMCPEFFNMLLKEDVFFSEIGNGRWININNAVFEDVEIPEKTRELLVRLLLENNVPIVSTKNYPHVMNAVEMYHNKMDIVFITPRLARDKLRNVSLGSLTSKEKIFLLKYLLGDGHFADLHGFELLPLADGSFCKFALSRGNNTVFYSVSNECSMELLPGLCNIFIDDGLDESLRKQIIDGSKKTGINQVQQLKPNMISKLIKDALPRDWLTQPDVIWYPGRNGHPPQCWLEKFWNFLQKVCKDPECNIQEYEGITLIPTNFRQGLTTIKLVQLKRNSHIMVSSQYSHLDPRFEEILPLLHLIPVYTENAEFVKFPQNTWNRYFHRADPNDILRIFDEAGTIQRLQNDVDNLSADHVRLLRSWLKDVRDMKYSERNILVNIAVQKATHILGSSNHMFQSAIANNKQLRTVSKDDLPTDGFLTEEILLDTSDEDSKNLASKLCLKPCPRDDVLCQMVRCTQRYKSLTSLVIWIMERWDEFHLASKRKIRSEIQDRPFIPFQNGSFKRAYECFDPSDELLTKLFSGHSDVFPTQPFGNKYQSILREFGLKTRSGVTKDDVRRCVAEITSASDVEKSYGLLELLEENPRKFLMDIHYLKYQQWVPVVKDIDSNIYPSGLPRFNSGHINLVSPNDAKSVSCAHLVGSTLPLVSNRFHVLSKQFEWESNFKPDKIYLHLLNIVKYVSEQNQIGNKVDTPRIERILHEIYKYMQNNLEDFNSFTENEDKLVWTGQSFIAPTKISIQKTRHSLEPYVFTLHPGFSGYKRLFRKFGAIEKYDETAKSMLCLFEEIKTFHEMPDNPEVTYERIDHDRDLAIQVIECIIDLNKENLTDEVRERIFLPVAAPNDDGLQFASCDDVCFPNEDWLELDEFDNIMLVHEKVSRKIYNCLGVIPLGQKISGAMSLLGFQQAGQKEDLTKKLRNILDSGYTEDSIANEMIQNADDAGAKEVKFMVDMRRNSAFNSKLLDKGMKAWHGPALWVYNDATFSDADFENITKIGGRTKESKQEQIGTFGLGFNSVYHITDVPSFLSRGLIGFLDPHTEFLDSQLSDKRNPGIRIDLNRSKMTLKRFENQFKPYHGIFNCNIFDTNEVNLDGTLFRLPLRLRSIGRKSQISDKCFGEDDILRLMQNVNTMSEKLLLFTQHVTKISIHYLGDQQEPQHAVQLFSVTKRPKRYMKEINKSLKKQRGEKKFEIQNCILHEASQFLLNKSKTNATEYPSSLTKLSIEHCLTSEGALRFRTTSEHFTNEWIVLSSMGQSKALDLYKSDTSRYKIPCGGVALPVRSNLKQGEVFCFLPLSIPTSGIPCHINGNFEVANDRRSLWRRGTLYGVKDMKSDWNDAIFSDIITRSYVSLLRHKEAQSYLVTDYDLWPNEMQIVDQSEYFPLLEAFYRAVAHGIDNSGDKPCVFNSNDKWLNIDSIIIYKPDNHAIADDVKKVLQRFISPEMYVIDVPDKVVNGFNRAGCTEYIHQKIYTEERFFKEIFFPKISKIENEIRNKLTMHAIDHYKKPLYRQLLESTACIPTDNTSTRLEKISAVVHPHGKVADLFEPEENRFPIASFQMDDSRMEVMVKLGMIKDDMDLPELLERARVFEKSKHQRQHKIKKIQCFMNFLETKQRIINKKFIDALLCIQILPVLKSHTCSSFPSNFPWYGDECSDFLHAENLYPADCDLVCFVKPIIDEVVFHRCQDTESVCRIFNLSKQMRTPSCQDVIQQLKQLAGIQNKYLVANEPTVLRLCKRIYSNLEGRLQDSSNDNIDELCNGKWPWVWNGEGFSCTSSVCVNEGSIDLRPYHFSVHRSLRSHKHLLQHCNVALEPSEQLNDLIRILHQIKMKHDTVSLTADVARDRHLVIGILTYIKNHTKYNMMEHFQDILIPIEDEELRMVTPNECCFCDDWFKRSLDVEHEEYLVHQDVTNITAEFFGVIPLSRKLSHSHEIGITQWGQKELLTQRLHNILQDYQAIDIPKEMIQNADDAKASEVKFLIDLSRNSNTKGLLGKGMALCHGPALCVFNDAMFTDDDFENITKLGGQTKREQTEKIGKFGLGFNSVYHLTDVPSFISNGRLTIFDPHRFHLGNQLAQEAPGIQINFRDQPTTLVRFSNQFQPYNNLFGCELHCDSFTGTLFRLPLRTNRQVQKGGKISKETFGNKEITELITRFCEQASEMLIFTKYVQRMSIYRRKNYEEELDCICNVVKEVLGESNGSMYKIRITVEFPNSGLQLDNKNSKQDWIIQPVQGTNDALNISRSPEGVKHGLNAFGGLAYKCDSDEIPAGLLFCFLPLSIPSSSLPVHINAKFSVAPDRRSLLKKGSGDYTTMHSEWNNALMKDVIARGYVMMLSEPTSRSLMLNDVLNNHKKDGLFSIWPRTDYVHTDVRHVVHSFYQAIVHGINGDTDLPQIFNVNQDWYTFNDVRFLDAELTDCHILPVVKDIMFRNGLVIVDLPGYIRKSFIDSSCSGELQRKTVSYQQFFEEQFFEKLTEMPDDLADEVVLYLLQHSKCDWIDEQLKCTPCIPSTDGARKLPSDLIDQSSRIISSMYLPEDGKFPLGNKFSVQEISGKLRSLGMLHLSVPFGYIVERCRSIEVLHQMSSDAIKICQERADAILRYIDSIKSTGIDTNDTELQEIQNIKFIPTETQPPKNYPVKWANLEVSFSSPNSVYTSDLSECVGAVAPIAKQLPCSRFTRKLLKMKLTPDLMDVIKQLEYLVATNCTNIDRVQGMYKHLMEEIQQNLTSDEDFIKESLQNLEVVLCSGNFMKIEDVALRCNRKFEPYLYQLPVELEIYQDVFKILGIEENFHHSTLLDICYLLQKRYDGRPLGHADLEVAIGLVHSLEDCKSCDDDERQILVPDKHGYLRPVDKLSFCLHDCSDDDIEGEILCHDLIPHKVAASLGIKDIRSSVLSKNGMKLKYGTQFGQVQKLTSRIGEILKGYPCDDSIFKELLQNSDDAGADEINFIYDPRRHQAKSVFCESWKETLGPALCVFNNRPFTEDDLKGIQDLGTSSKSIHPDKTGQYGIGFNSVYHLTDCPSFLTNDDIVCIFDPHCAFIDHATLQSPGYQYNITPKLNNMFQDALSCFRLDSLENKGCTMFRFPLRTTEMSTYAKSKDEASMSQEIFDEGKLQNLLDQFKPKAFNMLLYLNNLTKITISHIEDKQLKTDYWVKAELSPEDEKIRREFYNYVKECAKRSKLTEIKMKEATYEMKISDTSSNTQVWLVNQRIGSTGEIRESISSAYDEGCLKLLPRGGVAVCVSQELASTCAYCFLPLPISPNLPVNINGHFSLDSSRQNLSKFSQNSDWNSYVKCEVIAHTYSQLLEHLRDKMFKSVRGSKSQITCTSQELNDKMERYWRYFPNVQKNVYSEWQQLAEHVFLIVLRNKIPLFPVMRRIDDVISNKSKKSERINYSLEWLPAIEITGRKAYFYKKNMSRPPVSEVMLLADTKTENKKKFLKPILQQIGFKIVSVPNHIYRDLTNAESLLNTDINAVKCQSHQVEMVSPHAVVHFLKTDFEPGPLPCDITKSSLQSELNYLALLEYIDKDRELQEGKIPLDTMPLLLTQDSCLRRFDTTDTYFHSKNHMLLPKCFHEFVHEHAYSHFSTKSDEIIPFRIADLVERLNLNLDQQFNGVCKVAWDPEGKEIPNQAWIQELWNFMKDEFENHECFPNIEGEERFANIKCLMGNWAVLPVKVNLGVHNKVNNYLMPFSLADSVLHSSIPDSYFKDALSKMALPVVDDSIFPRKRHLFGLLSTAQSEMIDLISRFVATASKPERILMSLVSLLNENDRAFEVLDESEDKKNILLFFERFIGLQLNQQHIDSLRRLPCYRSIHNEFISLNHNKQQFVLHSGIPKIEKEQWITDTEAVFIVDDSNLKKLHVLLGLTKCTELDVYKQFILPAFYKFTHKGRIEHMQHIKTTLQSAMTNESQTMVSFMKSIPLVSHEGQPLKRIHEYFDSSVPIFRHMLEPNMFLPDPFREADWKKLMIELGLRMKPTETQILEFAHTIEQGMKFDFEEQTEKSKVLISYISNSEELKTNVMFLHDLRRIAFLAPCILDSNLLTLHKSFTEQRVGIAYDGALTHVNVHLTWTSANILQSYANPSVLASLFSKKRTRLNDILLKLNVSDKPSLDIVLKHTRNICTHLKEEYSQSKRSGSGATSSKCQAALHKVMDNIYTYISKLCRENSEQVKKELMDVPIMLVDDDRILIEAKYTVKTLKKDIVLTPYIRQIPGCFIQYMDLFSCLGAQEKPSICQCCELLKIIHDDIKDDLIENPNMMSVIKFAVRKIFKSYKEKDWLKDTSVLYLPNRNCQLVESSTLKYYDEPMFEVRMNAENDKNILLDLKEVRLDNAVTDYIENMPTELKPCKFSKHVKEIMTSNPEENKCRYAKEGLCEQLNVIRCQVQSKEFRHGIYRLLKHEANLKGVELPETVLSNVPQLSQEHMSIECLNKLETHFVQSDKIIEGSKDYTYCFLQRLEDHVTIFISHQDSANPELKMMLIEHIICKQLTGVLDHMTVLAMMISRKLSGIQTLLTKRNIPTLDANTSGSMSIPQLGSEVPDHIIASLDNDPFNEFTPGEYVAYELNEQELFVYAKIIRNSSGSKSINCIYEIDFGNVDNREVSALNLYKWLPGNHNVSESQHVDKPLQMYVAPESREESVPVHHIPHQQAPTPPLYENLEEAKDKLSDKLEEIWKLGEDERKKAIKRLYLKWHPDKNPNHEDFCCEVFKHLKNEIKRLEEGLPRKQSGGAESSEDNYYSDFGRWEDPFRKWNQRAGRDKQKREYYDNSYGGSGSRSGARFGNGASFSSGTYPDFTSNNSPRPTPMSDQPRLWQSQALEDLRAAQNDIDGYPSYEWVAYKCLQAAEKSLKAAILSSTGTSCTTDDIKWLSITVEVIPGCPDDLRKYVNELCAHGKDQNATRYPCQFDNEIPHNIYDRKDANKCILNAKTILDMMDRLIALNDH